MSGKVERGSVQKGDSVLLLPGNGDDVASVKGLQVHGKAAQAAFVGDMVEMGLSGLEHDVRTRAYPSQPKHASSSLPCALLTP